MRASFAFLGLLACKSGLVQHEIVGDPPEAEILLPDGTAPVFGGSAVRFVASVGDSQDSPEQLKLAWRSDRQGQLDSSSANGEGLASFDFTGLVVGEHVITLTATDTDGNRTSDAIGLEVQAGASPGSGTGTGAATGTGTGSGGGTGTGSATGAGTGTGVGTGTGSGTGTGGTGTGPGTGGGNGTGTGSGVGTGTGTGSTSAANCSAPVTWTRVTHSHGAVDFREVAFAPNGDYALILGYPDELYRYDTATQAVDYVGSGGGEYWEHVAFSTSGDYALIGGGDDPSYPSPVLWHYEDGVGLTAVSSLSGAPGGPLSSVRIAALDAHPTTGQWVVLSDNAAPWPSNIACLNTLDADFATGSHTWESFSCVNIDQGAASIAWGSNLGQPIALGVSYYLELLYFDPQLSSGQFSLQSHPNTGNLGKVAFDPTNDAVAWVLNWSGSNVYTWEGVLRTDPAESFSFTGWTIWDFDVASDGSWKMFVGRNGDAWLSDSPWRPVDDTAFVNVPVPSWDQPPWSGTSNDYLMAVDWRPSSCEGLAVGDATSNQGTIAHFTLQ